MLGPCNFWKTDSSTRWFGHCIIHKCSPLGQILLNLSIFWIISEQWESAWHVTEPDCVPLFCRLEVLSEKRQLSYPVSMEDIALLNSESNAFISWCETQDEFLNVSVAFNIWEPYLMSPLDFSKSTSRGLWKGELLITWVKEEAGSLESEGVVLRKALNWMGWRESKELKIAVGWATSAETGASLVVPCAFHTKDWKYVLKHIFA